MDSDELSDLSPEEDKPQPPKPEVMIIPDDSTTSGSESGNSSFIFKPTTPRTSTASTGTASTNATIDYYPVV